MKKLFFNITVILAILLSVNLSAQNGTFKMESVKSFPHATFQIDAFVFDAQKGYTIEVDNNQCGVNDSPYLSKPIAYNSVSYSGTTGGFTTQNGKFIFTTPFTINDLNSKWLRWRVKDNNGNVSEWKCYSWSDYCTSLLKSDGSCK